MTQIIERNDIAADAEDVSELVNYYERNPHESLSMDEIELGETLVLTNYDEASGLVQMILSPGDRNGRPIFTIIHSLNNQGWSFYGEARLTDEHRDLARQNAEEYNFEINEDKCWYISPDEINNGHILFPYTEDVDEEEFISVPQYETEFIVPAGTTLRQAKRHVQDFFENEIVGELSWLTPDHELSQEFSSRTQLQELGNITIFEERG